MSSNIVDSFLVPPPALKLGVGVIVQHQPRQTYYQILFRTMIKGDGKWEYGWCYQEVKKETDSCFSRDEAGQIYSRPDSKFDSDWKQIIL